VVFTRLDEQGDDLGGVDAKNEKELNEGQKMVFSMQDAALNNKVIDVNNIEQPELISGVKLD
jgi:hypothetical protein